MANKYTYYDNHGNIVGTSLGEAPEPFFENNSYIDGQYSFQTHYIAGGVVKEKTEFPIEVNGSTITGVPIGTMVNINGESVMCNDGTVEIVKAGTYPVKVVLQKAPFVTKELFV
jgi:hypothetical protein